MSDALSAARPRQIWLCADDYGIAPGVNSAIRELIMRGRLNATSVMVTAPSFQRSDAVSLGILNSGERWAAIGLHVTLTAPFKPLSTDFRPLREGAFPPLPTLLRAASLRLLNRERLKREIAAQLKAFAAAFGRAPDFIDGHQHVQLFPQVRDAFLEAVKENAPAAWVRQCGRALPPYRRFGDRKALLLDWLSVKFRRRARALKLRTNPAFAGAYDFRAAPDYAAVFPGFLQWLPAGSVVMCHPGSVDDELRRLDPLTTQREKEHAYLAGDAFPQVLAAHGLALTAA